MNYLNLTEGFNPYNSGLTNTIKHKSFFFNGGEPHIKLDMTCFGINELSDVTITSRLTSMNDLMMLMVAAEALNQCGYLDNLFLFIPYVPGARQDRRMVEGEPLTIKVIANMINSCEFSNVVTFDNHSDVSTALIDNCDNLDNHKFVEKCINRIYSDVIEKPFHLISPDAGANKKIKGLGMYLNKYCTYPLFITKCDKDRNTSTGEITGFDVYNEDLEKRDCVIVDDICDGGGTFIGLAKELKKKNAGDIYLAASHGIFSKPLKELKPYFKKIYTTDSWRSEFCWEQIERDSTDLVEIIKFKDFM